MTPPPPPEGRTLLDDLDGRQRRDAGAHLAEQSAHTSWRLAAEHTIGQLAAAGFDFTADDVTGVVGAAPGHKSALGALFLAAARRGEIVPVGYRQSGRVEARARALRVWRGATPIDRAS